MNRFESLVRDMIERRASDLFLGEGRPPAFRVDGRIVVSEQAPMTREEIRRIMETDLRKSQRERFEREGDLDVGISRPGLGRFRANFHLQRGLLGAAIRRVPKASHTIEELGLPPLVRRMAELPRGLILVTGNTGSGKSTSLAAMVHHINSTSSRHIVTIEDPVEFIHEDIKSIVTQREVGTDTRDFLTALRHVVRESPDVILVGELRDMETLNVAISAALTGHLVLASFHAIDATHTLQRILSFYAEHVRHQVCMDLALSLLGIVAQRLVPRAEENGRILATEVLAVTPAVRRLIREQRIEEIPDLMLGMDGLQTFTRSLVSLYDRGLISFETGEAYANTPDEFRLYAHGMARSSQAFAAEHEGIPSVANIDMRTLLTVAVRYGASDIHLTVGTPPILRIDGRLGPLGEEKMSASDVRRLLFGLLSHAQRERFEIERELDFAVTLTGKTRFRVNAHYQRGTPAVAMRLIPSEIPDFDTLGLPRVVRDIAARPHGLVLVVGPTGVGKSTTLAAIIDAINTVRNCHIITIEDPIEFIHYNKSATVEQREVGVDTLSFAAALKYILRQDPDVILVGEMRDPETIGAALTAAETGHLVLASLHTNDAAQSVDRVIDSFPPHQQPQVRSQFASALLAILSQRLLNRADGRGRVPAFEVLTATNAVRAVIREGKVHQLQSIMESSMRDGMITMDRAVSDLYHAGIVGRDEASRYVKSRLSLQKPC